MTSNLDSLAAALKKGTMVPQTGEKVLSIGLEKIKAGRFQPRTQFNQESIDELAESIANQGVIQPIVLREISKDKYEIIAGERRFRACQKLASMPEYADKAPKEIPAIIRNVDNKAALAMALAENIDREDMTLADEANGILRLIEETGMNQADVVKMLGKGKKWVSTRVSLARSNKAIRDFIQAGYSRDADGLYELARLYEHNADAAAELMSKWDNEPEVRTSLRLQVIRLRDALTSAESEQENVIQLQNDGSAEQQEARQESQKPSVTDTVEQVIQTVTKKTSKGGQKGDDAGSVKQKSADNPPLPFRMPPIVINQAYDDEGALIFKTNEGEMRFQLSDKLVLESIKAALEKL